MKILIKNGHVVTAVDSYVADILVEDSTIAMIGSDLTKVVSSPDRVIDAAGRLVIPGGIDPHTHMDLPFAVLQHPTISKLEREPRPLEGRRRLLILRFNLRSIAKSGARCVVCEGRIKATIDYGFHMIVTDMPDSRLGELNGLIQQGISSFKLFMAYPGVFWSTMERFSRRCR